MSMGDIQVGCIGLTFELTIKDENGTAVNVSSATTKEIIFDKGNNINVTKAAAFVTSGTDGKIKYVTIANDLDVAGTWTMQGHIVTATAEWYTDKQEFTVKVNL